MIKFPRLFGRDPLEDSAHHLYIKIVEQARHPVFYTQRGVADTVEGRFDMVTLHAFLVLRRLRRDQSRTAPLAQALFDLMFSDMDQNLRELGVGDMGIGRRVKKLAEAFYGRVAAYDEGLDTDDHDETLMAALDRNLYRRVTARTKDLAAMATYMRRETDALADQSTSALMKGHLAFGEPPARPGADQDKEET